MMRGKPPTRQVEPLQPVLEPAVAACTQDGLRTLLANTVLLQVEVLQAAGLCVWGGMVGGGRYCRLQVSACACWGEKLRWNRLYACVLGGEFEVRQAVWGSEG